MICTVWAKALRTSEDPLKLPVILFRFQRTSSVWTNDYTDLAYYGSTGDVDWWRDLNMDPYKNPTIGDILRG